MFRRITNLSIILALALSMFACQSGAAPEATQPAAAPTQAPGEPQPTQAEAQPTDAGIVAPTQAPDAAPPTGKPIKLGTTGFTRDAGLLKLLIKDFTAKTGIPVEVVVRVNPNQVLNELGEAGGADVLLVHDPEAEVSFVEKGYGVERRLVMHNDFVVVGPDADPANVGTAKNANEAYRRIAGTQSPYVSRGDNSIVDRLETYIWNRIKVKPSGAWYFETGREMGDTLVEASQRGAYVLTDRATFLMQKPVAALNLSILLQGDPKLMNYYHVIVVSPEKFPELNVAGAKAFSEYLVSADAQKIIAEYGIDMLGQATFFADGNKTDAELGLPEADFE